MKSIYKKYLTIAVVVTLASCSSDYLDTTPTNKVSPETIFETTTNAKMAINGIAKLMTSQHLKAQGYNGEGTIKLYYGELQGDNLVVPKGASSEKQILMTYNSNDEQRENYYPWYYYYSLISNANLVLNSIDNAKGPEKERATIKAQALTYRAYSNFMLAQIYGNRWVDSNEGTTPAIVLKKNTSDKNQPLSTLGEAYDFIYEDLTEAINLFKVAEYERKESDFFEIDQSVAEAIFARVALTKQDYVNAAKYAKNARAKYALMDNENYQKGFFTPTKEWIWGSFGATDETLYFYSFFSYFAYNSSAGQIKNYPRRINKKLFEKIPKTDIRRGLFLDPENYDYNKETDLVKGGSDLDKKARKLFPEINSASKIYAHMQFKIGASDMPGVGNLVHIRASEMYLIEAEAEYFLGNTTNAQQLLVQLNTSTKRDESYTCAKTGQDLFNEIRTYRGIELWGEGSTWFDLKRWNVDLVREDYTKQGNVPVEFSKTITPEQANKWTYVIPKKEKEQNPNI
ncbi:RagB/SusD family nutrient uptake outer membrane protein [Myroides injenensis]|uniref:RagB/SusD family nutrient uptake outer membrane protein n=1 Tax=Myroides injenensis TaxID=1183151 RepID=UPI000287CE07|nr:RagB/SusD family nutrient uptake outer membrane protein [Myroides injenensis]